MQEIVECKLVVNSEINGVVDCVVVTGKGYCKKSGEENIVYFSNENMKYKYVYNRDNLIVYCNDSFYKFKLNEKEEGKIKKW